MAVVTCEPRAFCVWFIRGLAVATIDDGIPWNYQPLPGQKFADGAQFHILNKMHYNAEVWTKKKECVWIAVTFSL